MFYLRYKGSNDRVTTVDFECPDKAEESAKVILNNIVSSTPIEVVKKWDAKLRVFSKVVAVVPVIHTSTSSQRLG